VPDSRAVHLVFQDRSELSNGFARGIDRARCAGIDRGPGTVATGSGVAPLKLAIEHLHPVVLRPSKADLRIRRMDGIARVKLGEVQSIIQVCPILTARTRDYVGGTPYAAIVANEKFVAGPEGKGVRVDVDECSAGIVAGDIRPGRCSLCGIRGLYNGGDALVRRYLSA